MQQRTLFFNGINYTSGEYGLNPMDAGELARRIAHAEASQSRRSGSIAGDQLRQRSYQQRQQSYGISVSLDPSRLNDAGWGAVFPRDADLAVRDALSPLLELRRQQAGERFRIFERAEGYQPGQTSADFLGRQGAVHGWMDPASVPYYLLLVGGPEEIPFDFQRQLDVQYAVGRIGFDTLEQYANYAANVVAAEQGAIRPARRAVLFGVNNPDDPPSRQAVDQFIKPLHEGLAASLKRRQPDWRLRAHVRDATKARLAQLLGGGDAPSLLVVAGHGLEAGSGDPLQRDHQGALLCADWPGPQAWSRQRIPESFYFSAEDLKPGADLSGLVAFFFDSFSAGTPRRDELAGAAAGNAAASGAAAGGAADMAPAPFLARLPATLLGRPRGALAVVGLAGRAWGYSQSWQGAGAMTAVVQSALERLLDGSPIGMATEYFDERYAETATQLDEELFRLQYAKGLDPSALAALWVAARAFSNTIILGDPAVRLGGSRAP